MGGKEMHGRTFLIGAAADFAKFWDADTKRAGEAVHLIGRVQGRKLWNT
jgi:hypothetical protein